MFADNNLRQWNDVLVIQIQQQVYLTQAAHRKSFHQHQQRPHYLTFFCNSLRRAQAELWMSRQICGKLHQWLRQHQSASPASVSVTLHYITLHGMYSQWPRHALMFERTQLTDSSHTHTAFVHFALSKTWIQLTTQHSWHSWLTALYCSDSVTTYCEKLNVFPRSVSVTTVKSSTFPWNLLHFMIITVNLPTILNFWWHKLCFVNVKSLTILLSFVTYYARMQ